ncbi:MAG: SH3 domain-containing protein [Chloroflexota bacterium]
MATIAIIIAFIAAVWNYQRANAPVPSTSGSVFVTITAASDIQLPAVTLPSGVTALPTLMSDSTLSPTRVPPTDLPGLVITPINGALYEVTGSVGALGCPDSHCKEISTYKKGNILVVTGSVIGTTYKTKKTRIWYQVISHDGSRVYVHGEYIKPHDTGSR